MRFWVGPGSKKGSILEAFGDVWGTFAPKRGSWEASKIWVVFLMKMGFWTNTSRGGVLPLSNSKYPKVRTLNMDQYGANISGTALVPCGTVADFSSGIWKLLGRGKQHETANTKLAKS